jgi:hypothetical protein
MYQLLPVRKENIVLHVMDDLTASEVTLQLDCLLVTYVFHLGGIILVSNSL